MDAFCDKSLLIFSWDMGRVNFDTDSYTYQQDQRKLSRYRNPYKHPDTLAVADAHFDGATSYTEQYIPTRVNNNKEGS